MAENIIEGLFGVNPNQLRQQQYQQDYSRATEYAKLDPFQQGTQAMYQGAAGLARPIAGMMGMVNPQEEEARQKQAVMSQGGDLNTPEGLMAKAEQFRQSGDIKTAFQLTQLAQQRKQEQAKLSLEQAKAKREDWRIGEEFEWKKQQAKDALEARMEQARMRSEDMRLSTEQRAEAARDANATRLQIAQLMASMKQQAQGQKLTKGQEAADREFGKEYAQYQAGGGSADVEKQLKQLEQVSQELGKPGNEYTGPVVGLIPTKLRSMTNPEAIAAQNKVEEVAQRNLRLVLGAQFTQNEGERLIARAYNPQMPPAENKARVDALVKQIRTAAQIKEDAARYFEENGTLTGWKGRMPTLSDFESAIESAKPSKGAGGAWKVIR
jgi:hypothetical protein